MENLLQAGLSNALWATILALLVAGLSRPLARRPAILHGLWLLVLLKLITPPFYVVAIPWPLPADAASHEALIPVGEDAESLVEGDNPPEDLALSERPGDDDSALDAGLVPTLPSRSRSVLAAQRSPLDWRRWALSIWTAGTLVVLAVSCRRIWRFHGIIREAKPATDEERERIEELAGRIALRRVPEVCWVRSRISPLVWSLGLRPRLLIPRDLWKTLDERQRSALLVHELAHLKRGDHRVRLLEVFITALYWWHPLVGWMRQSLRDVEEQCCDAWVIWALPDAARSYAETLIDTLAYVNRSAGPDPLLASGLGEVPQLRRRLTMIMTGTSIRALGARGTLALCVLAGVMLPVGATWAQQAQPNAEVQIDGKQADGSVTATVTADAERSLFFVGDVIVQQAQPASAVTVEVRAPDGPGGGKGELEGIGRVEDVIKALEEEVAELEKGANPSASVAQRIKTLRTNLYYLRAGKLSHALYYMRKADAAPATRSVTAMTLDAAGKETSPEITKLRKHVADLRASVELKLTEIELAQAEIRKLGGDPGDAPLVRWRRTPVTLTIASPTRPAPAVTELKEVFVTRHPAQAAETKLTPEQVADLKMRLSAAGAAYESGRFGLAAERAGEAAKLYPHDPNAKAMKARAERAQKRASEPRIDTIIDPNRLELLESRLKSLQSELESLKKSSTSNVEKK